MVFEWSLQLSALCQFIKKQSMKGEKERGGEIEKCRGKECEWEKEENNVREEKQGSGGKMKK